MIDFTLRDEQNMLVEMTCSFVEKEMVPHEDELERTNCLPKELAHSLKEKSMELGLHACNLPAKVGGGGLDAGGGRGDESFGDGGCRAARGWL